MFLAPQRVSWWASLTIAVPAALVKWGVSAVRVGPMLRIRCRDIGHLWIRMSLGWKESQRKGVRTEEALQSKNPQGQKDFLSDNIDRSRRGDDHAAT